MEWVPRSGWLTKVRVDADAGQLSYDLAVDATGAGTPSRVAAGLDLPAGSTGPEGVRLGLALAVLALGVAVVGGLMLARPARFG